MSPSTPANTCWWAMRRWMRPFTHRCAACGRVVGVGSAAATADKSLGAPEIADCTLRGTPGQPGAACTLDSCGLGTVEGGAGCAGPPTCPTAIPTTNIAVDRWGSPTPPWVAGLWAAWPPGKLDLGSVEGCCCVPASAGRTPTLPQRLYSRGPFGPFSHPPHPSQHNP